MPKYDYRCGAGHVYEKREGFDAPAVQECEVCGSQARRVLTPPAIVFKGSGWYVTDSRGSTNGTASTSPATPATENASSTESTPSESKPDSTKSDTSSLPAAAD